VTGGDPRVSQVDDSPADDGMTLIEILVGMVLMGIVMAIFTTGVLAMYKTGRSVDSATEAQTRMLSSFNRLEREIRYAEQINPPRKLSADYVVEYVITDSDSVDQCVQLWLKANGDLKRRQWPVGGAATTPSVAIATGLTVGPADITLYPAGPAPFTVYRAGDPDGLSATVSNFDRLIVYLTTTNDSSVAGNSRLFNLQFTALNTVQPADRRPDSDCVRVPA
jgi:prepilin-type N-terminal cleavage/methylation domain-containing protein